MKPSKKNEPSSPKSKNSEEDIDWKTVFLSSLFGGIIGFGFFSLFVIYLFSKNAI